MADEILKLVSDRVEWRLVDDEIVALDLVRSEYLGINAAGSVLWPMLAEGTTRSAMESALVSTFSIEPPASKRDVAAFVDELQRAGLIETQ